MPRTRDAIWMLCCFSLMAIWMFSCPSHLAWHVHQPESYCHCLPHDQMGGRAGISGPFQPDKVGLGCWSWSLQSPSSNIGQTLGRSSAWCIVKLKNLLWEAKFFMGGKSTAVIQLTIPQRLQRTTWLKFSQGHCDNLLKFGQCNLIFALQHPCSMAVTLWYGVSSTVRTSKCHHM